jgi:glyoxylase-like metal-dependent hydrolase (beta-lactamase superfamily II)/ferredoxin
MAGLSMASIQKLLPENVPGDFFVDSTCIDCDACRQLAPATFRDEGDYSIVYQQPQTEDESRLALMALVACPTGSIGSREHHDYRIGIESFPARVTENIYFCGFTSELSFGAWSYLIVRPASEGGNVLVDSPRFSSQLVKKIEHMGGVETMFLTHRDDVADHQRFADRFGCRRIMHADDGARRLGVEMVVEGEGESRIDKDLLVIPTPGHTRGHAVLLYQDKFLFTGDHLAWSPVRETLTAFRSACWYSWTEQIRSMERLQNYEFEWVLPGHGRIHHGSREEMSAQLSSCIGWMKQHV